MADPSGDEQDVAETLDEDNLIADGDDIANFDELPDLLDVTSAVSDADEDEASDDDLEAPDDDPDLDDSPRTRLEDRPDNEAFAADESDRAGAPPGDEAPTYVGDAEHVTTEDREKPNRFESSSLSDAQLEDLGYGSGR